MTTQPSSAVANILRSQHDEEDGNIILLLISPSKPGFGECGSGKKVPPNKD